MGELQAELSRAAVDALGALETTSRRLHPLAIPVLREQLQVHAETVQAARQRLLGDSLHHDEGSGKRLIEAAGLILDAVDSFGGGGGDMTQAFISVLRSLRKCCQAQELLFPLRHEFPEIDLFFLEPGTDMQGRGRDACIVHRIPGDGPYGRGGYSFFVPETYAPGREWPLVVALHGGYGHGRDFLWTWLREARSRGFLLMAPTSAGQTWSLADIGSDVRILGRHLDEVCSRYAVDRSRILLTGMSDGGTFALGLGLGSASPSAVIAPVSCVLPPVDLVHARGRRILWVHGARDWMFPVDRAARACEDLSKAGADVRLRIIPDLAHAYPREENDAILRWFMDTQFRRVDVGTVANEEGGQVPAEITDRDRHERILEILDRWHEGGSPGRPEVAYFKVRTEKSRIYILRHAVLFDAWGACEPRGTAPDPCPER